MGKDRRVLPDHLVREQTVTYEDYAKLTDEAVRYLIVTH